MRITNFIGALRPPERIMLLITPDPRLDPLNLDMPGMTMVFKVANPKMLEVKPGSE